MFVHFVYRPQPRLSNIFLSERERSDNMSLRKKEKEDFIREARENVIQSADIYNRVLRMKKSLMPTRKVFLFVWIIFTVLGLLMKYNSSEKDESIFWSVLTWVGWSFILSFVLCIFIGVSMISDRKARKKYSLFQNPKRAAKWAFYHSCSEEISLLGLMNNAIQMEPLFDSVMRLHEESMKDEELVRELSEMILSAMKTQDILEHVEVGLK